MSRDDVDRVPVDDQTDGESDPSSNSEIQQLYEEVVKIIDCLYQLSMIIRKPAQHDVLFNTHEDEAPQYEPFDKNHVRDKYVQADLAITDRLGRANARRR